jgi:phosphoheptose isomerase
VWTLTRFPPSDKSDCLKLQKELLQCLRGGGKFFLAGNGGSAADANTLPAKFLSRLNFDRHPPPAIALTSDTSVLTAIGLDLGIGLALVCLIAHHANRR